MTPDASFWGPVTAGMDWCEGNYVLLGWIAEFFNTVSSLALVSAGLLGAWLHRRQGSATTLLFLSLVVIGLGSVAFHATLRFSMQLMDELPMLWSVLLILYLFAGAHTRDRSPRWALLALLAWGVGTAAAMVLVPREWEFRVFLPSFAIAQTACVLGGLPLYWRHGDGAVQRAFWIGAGAQALASACWFADQGACDWLSALPYGLPNPQLHAWWHTLVAVATYHWLVVVVLLHGRAFGDELRIEMRGGVLPSARRVAVV